MLEPVEVVPVCWLVPVEEAVEVAVDNVEDGVVVEPEFEPLEPEDPT